MGFETTGTKHWLQFYNKFFFLQVFAVELQLMSSHTES